MTIEHITDHETRGAELLIERYRKPTIIALLASWLSGVQAVEDALWQLLVERAVANAIGKQLDVLGKIVGQPREGRTDAGYRIWIAARILVLRSSGKPEELVAITKKLVGADVPVRIEEFYPMAIVVHAETGIAPATGVQIAKLLQAAKGGGISLQFTWTSNLAGAVLRFAPGLVPVPDSPHGLDNGVLAAVSNGNNVEFALVVAPDVPSDALLSDDDGEPLVFDGDNDFLLLG